MLEKREWTIEFKNSKGKIVNTSEKKYGFSNLKFRFSTFGLLATGLVEARKDKEMKRYLKFHGLTLVGIETIKRELSI